MILVQKERAAAEIVREVVGYAFWWGGNADYVQRVLKMRWVTTTDGVSEWCYVGKGIKIDD